MDEHFWLDLIGLSVNDKTFLIDKYKDINDWFNTWISITNITIFPMKHKDLMDAFYNSDFAVSVQLDIVYELILIIIKIKDSVDLGVSERHLYDMFLPKVGDIIL